MLKIAHIVNPVMVDESSDLFVAQPITFETMRVAQRSAAGLVDVALFSAQYAEDDAIAPSDFLKTPHLKHSVLDVATFQQSRKLPLIREILDRLYTSSDAEYLIYTNVDIGLMPQFYSAVNQIIHLGYDAFVINRRTLPTTFTEIQQLPLIYAQAGEPHGGHDCFVFKRELYPRFDLGTACIGAGRIGKILFLNLIYHAAQFAEFKDLHLTFHLGDRRIWKSTQFSDYFLHNEQELCRILKTFSAKSHLPPHPVVKALSDRYLPPFNHPIMVASWKVFQRFNRRWRRARSNSLD